MPWFRHLAHLGMRFESESFLSSIVHVDFFASSSKWKWRDSLDELILYALRIKKQLFNGNSTMYNCSVISHATKCATQSFHLLSWLRRDLGTFSARNTLFISGYWSLIVIFANCAFPVYQQVNLESLWNPAAQVSCSFLYTVLALSGLPGPTRHTLECKTRLQITPPHSKSNQIFLYTSWRHSQSKCHPKLLSLQ